MANNTYIGVDLGGTSLLAAVVDTFNGRIMGESKRKTRPELGAAGVANRLMQTIDKAIDDAHLKSRDIAGIGIGVPGPIDLETGVVVRCENLGPSWDQFALGDTVKATFKLPIILDNDVNVGAVGEHAFGAGKGFSEMLAIFVGTGVGGGIISANKLYAGARNSAGEVGHMVLAADSDLLCNCGQTGCAETLCSRTAIERDIRTAIASGAPSVVPGILQETERDDISAGIIGDAYDAGDAVTRAAVANAQRYLGLLIASCVNLLDPQIIVVGGGVLARMGEPYLAPVRRTAQEHYINKVNADRLPIVCAALGDYSGVIGAAVLARERLNAS